MKRPRVGDLVLCAVLTGCSAAGYGSHGPPASRDVASTGSVVLYVKNDHAEDIRVFLLRGSTQIPVGSVQSLNSRRFVIPPAQVGTSGTLGVIARALGPAESRDPWPSTSSPVPRPSSGSRTI